MKLLFSALSLILLVSCGTTANISRPSDAIQKNIAAFQVNPDRAKIYFHNGKIVGNIFGLSHKFSSDFFINSQVIGSMNDGDVMVFDLKPGTYNFGWSPRTTNFEYKNVKSIFREFKVSAGEVLIIRGDWELSGVAMFTGVVGQLLAPPKPFISNSDKSAVQKLQVVIPQSCPETTCIK